MAATRGPDNAAAKAAVVWQVRLTHSNKVNSMILSVFALAPDHSDLWLSLAARTSASKVVDLGSTSVAAADVSDWGGQGGRGRWSPAEDELGFLRISPRIGFGGKPPNRLRLYLITHPPHRFHFLGKAGRRDLETESAGSFAFPSALWQRSSRLLTVMCGGLEERLIALSKERKKQRGSSSGSGQSWSD